MCSRASTSKSGKARWSPSWERRAPANRPCSTYWGFWTTTTAGNTSLDGKPIKNLSETKAAEYRNRMIGFIFQSFNLISYKNAMENVALPLYYQGVPRRKRNAMALEFLDRLGLRRLRPATMPDGNVRRTEAARGDRPLADHPAADHSGRRADRRSRRARRRRR